MITSYFSAGLRKSSCCSTLPKAAPSCSKLIQTDTWPHLLASVLSAAWPWKSAPLRIQLLFSKDCHLWIQLAHTTEAVTIWEKWNLGDLDLNPVPGVTCSPRFPGLTELIP